jgi:hypothetical protein
VAGAQRVVQVVRRGRPYPPDVERRVARQHERCVCLDECQRRGSAGYVGVEVHRKTAECGYHT